MSSRHLQRDDSLFFVLLVLVLVVVTLHNAVFGLAQGRSRNAQDDKSNKFRQREATDDQLPYQNLDEEALTNTQCPQHVELRWQTEVSSSVYTTPLVADINSDGKLEVVVPTFVHNIEVLDGSDGDKLPGWPASHQSTVHSSPLLYDVDKDGVREITVATYHGEVLFFRPSGYQMTEKLVLPRERIRKDWHVGVVKDHADRSHPDIHDEGLIAESLMRSSSDNERKSSQLGANETVTVAGDGKGYGAESSLSKDGTAKVEDEGHGDPKQKPESNSNVNLSGSKADEDMKQDDEIAGNVFQMGAASLNITDPNVPVEVGAQRRLLEDAGSTHSDGATGEKEQAPTVENDQDVLEDAADASFNVFRDEEENMEDGLTEEYQYDYDDYVDESMWGDENFKEAQHEKEEDYINVDAHILCTPVIADIDRDGVDEMIIAVSYFFDHDYYDNPDNAKELGNVDISKYVACGIVVFNMDTKQLKWKKLLDLSTDDWQYRAYIYSSPTVVDLDNDGYLDVVVGTLFGFCYVLDHRGEFREHFPLQMGEIQGQVLAADINDDGKIELVTTDTHGNVAAWTNEAKEIWEVHLKSLIAQGPVVGDVNGDEVLEIVIPTVSGNIYVLRGSDGAIIKPYPFRTHGRVMAPVLLVDLSSLELQCRGLTLVVPSFDGYLYLIDGPTACADVIDVGETSYSMVLADNVDGGDDLDLVVTTMNGNVFCFSTRAPYHPLRSWSSQSQGRNNFAVRQRHEAIYVLPTSRTFRDEGGESFWLQFNIVDKHRSPAGPYNVTATLLVPHNYMGPRRITENRIIDQPGRHQFKLPCVAVRSTGAVILEMVDKHGLYYSDEFSLTFHMHYYRLLKWMVILPMLGMFCILLWLHPKSGPALPSFSRD